MVLPAALLGGGTALLVSMATTVRALVRVVEGGLKSSVHRTSWEQTYLPIARSDRPVAKVVVDGAAARIAEGMAAGALYLAIRGRADMSGWVVQGGTLLAASLVLLVVAWLAFTLGLSRSAEVRAAAKDPETEPRPEMPIPDC
jgi:ATP/ADP translocase